MSTGNDSTQSEDSGSLVRLRCSAIVFRAAQVLLLHRERGGGPEWVLPGGTPRERESASSCARREVAEETGLHVTVDRVAFLMEASNREHDLHLLDVVFTTSEVYPASKPESHEPGLVPVFHHIEDLPGLNMLPPLAGHLRALHARGGRGEGAYLGNVWRPAPVLPGQGEGES